MRHTRQQVTRRALREFKLLDQAVSRLSRSDWKRPLPRPEGKDPWTVKDLVAHITYWKADVARTARKERRPPEVRGLSTNDHNHVVYERWRGRTPAKVLEWHRAVQEDLMEALKAAPDEWFGGKERGPQWPFDLDGHSAEHRIRDIQPILKD